MTWEEHTPENRSSQVDRSVHLLCKIAAADGPFLSAVILRDSPVGREVGATVRCSDEKAESHVVVQQEMSGD